MKTLYCSAVGEHTAVMAVKKIRCPEEQAVCSRLCVFAHWQEVPAGRTLEVQSALEEQKKHKEKGHKHG